MKVDLISGKDAGDGVNSVQVNELTLSCLRGVDLAFRASEEVELSGSMPDGTRNTVRVRVVRPEAFILIKAFALDERAKEKDAYDVAFVLRNHQPNVGELAERLRGLLTTDLAHAGFGILKAKFRSLDSIGPVWAARMFEGQGESFDQAQRAAFEDSQELFRLVTEVM